VKLDNSAVTNLTVTIPQSLKHVHYNLFGLVSTTTLNSECLKAPSPGVMLHGMLLQSADKTRLKQPIFFFQIT